MEDIYKKFAYDYDEFGSIDTYLGDEKNFLKELFAEYKVKSVLDCACGTGQHLCMLSDLGFNVSGSDYSESMIEVANTNLKKLGKNISLSQCDFRYLEDTHTNKFEAIVCLTTALPHLQTDEDLIIALKSMRKRLNEGGILVLTQGMTHYTLSLSPIEVVINRDEFSRIFIKEHDSEFQTIHILDLFHSENRVENNQYDIKYRILFDDDYNRLLSEAGFNSVCIYGDYDKSNYDKKSRRLIVVAVNEWHDFSPANCSLVES